MKRNTKIALFAGGVAVLSAAATAVISQVITKMLVGEALDRNEPDIMKKANVNISGGSGDFEREIELSKERAKELEENENIERVEIKSHDGIKLVGHLYPAENAKRIIIAVHGWRSKWSADFSLISSFWHDNGCTVLLIEQRGQGDSEGDTMGFGLTERYDCLDWIDYIEQINEYNLPIYLAGLSMGATTVLMASGLALPENVHGIMADCGFTSPKAIWKHVAEDNLHLSYKIREKQIDLLCRQKTNFGSEDGSTLMALAENTVPVLFVHGANDTFVPVEMTYENYKACIAPKRILIVPGAEHALSYIVDTESYQAIVKDFWKEHD